MKRRNAALCGAMLGVSLLSGCVERRYVVTSDPPGAVVLRNYQQIGAAPADDRFVYYGNYHFTLVKEGYSTLQVDQDVDPPWYEYFPLDFISENLVPWTVHDIRRFHYQLQPVQHPSTDQLLNRGQELRNRGQAIVATQPPPAQVAPPGPPLTPPPVPVVAPPGQ